MSGLEHKVDQLLDLFRDHDRRESETQRLMRDRLDKQGETLARIDERTHEHEKRLDRAEARARTSGAVTGGALGALVAAVAAAAKYVFGGGQ